MVVNGSKDGEWLSGSLVGTGGGSWLGGILDRELGGLLGGRGPGGVGVGLVWCTVGGWNMCVEIGQVEGWKLGGLVNGFWRGEIIGAEEKAVGGGPWGGDKIGGGDGGKLGGGEAGVQHGT